MQNDDEKDVLAPWRAAILEARAEHERELRTIPGRMRYYIRRNRRRVSRMLAVLILVIVAVAAFAFGRVSGLEAGRQLAHQGPSQPAGQVKVQPPGQESEPSPVEEGANEPPMAMAKTPEPEQAATSKPDLTEAVKKPIPASDSAKQGTVPTSPQSDVKMVDATLDRVEWETPVTVVGQKGQLSSKAGAMGVTEESWKYYAYTKKIVGQEVSDVAFQPLPGGTVLKLSTEGSANIDAIGFRADFRAAKYSVDGEITGNYFADHAKEVAWGQFGIRMEAAESPDGQWTSLRTITIRGPGTASPGAVLPASLRGHSTVFLRIVPTGSWVEWVTMENVGVVWGRLIRDGVRYRDELSVR